MHRYRITVAYKQLDGKEEYRTFNMAGESFAEVGGILDRQVVPGRRIVCIVRERMVSI